MDMDMKFFRKLPVPKELKEQFPADERIVKIKQERDPEIRRIFEGKSDKLLLIIGPCSADREDAVLDYLTRLSKVQEKVKDKIMIIPRVYTNKPRTTGGGYKGLVHQPDPEKKPFHKEIIMMPAWGILLTISADKGKDSWYFLLISRKVFSAC